MNKLILFPFLIMLLLSVISTAYGFEGIDTDNPVGNQANGTFIVNDYGQVKWLNNDTGSSYFVIDGYGRSIDPRIETEEPFKIQNTDSGKYEYYDNYADFQATHNQDIYIDNILDTNVFWCLLFAALGVGIALGVTVIGTGISDWAQRLAFYGAIWGVVWLFLTLSSKDLLINFHLGTIGYLIYGLLTMFFIVGIILDVQAGEA